MIEIKGKLHIDLPWVAFFCPGCNTSHSIRVNTQESPSWSWNGDHDKPVFSPSVLRRTGHYANGDKKECWCNFAERFPELASPDDPKCEVCHSFVGCNGAQPGQIIFLNDCTHALAGQVIDLPEWPNAT